MRLNNATEPDTSVAVVRVWAMGWNIRDCSVVTATTVPAVRALLPWASSSPASR